MSKNLPSAKNLVSSEMKKKNFLISVIVPAYNEEKNIGQCLDALKKQDFSHSNYEIIVVDNASTDKTGGIAKKMGVNVVFEPKKGIVFAFKKGINVARGDIVAFTDADTIVNKNWLSKIYRAFQSSPSLVAVGGRTIFRPITILSCLAEPLINLGCWSIRMFNGCNGAIKKAAYQKIGGVNEKINFNWENDLSLRIKSEGRFIFLWFNPVVTSSRHFKGLEGIKYSLKGLINGACLLLFKKTIFFHFGDVRE